LELRISFYPGNTREDKLDVKVIMPQGWTPKMYLTALNQSIKRHSILSLAVFAASEGFSRATASPTPQLYLEDANPMFLPAGKLLSDMVVVETTGPIYITFFFPETCSPPIGFCWPTTISIDDFFESVCLLSRPYKPFLQTLEGLKPAQSWSGTQPSPRNRTQNPMTNMRQTTESTRANAH
jgi:hypothetical protein